MIGMCNTPIHIHAILTIHQCILILQVILRTTPNFRVYAIHLSHTIVLPDYWNYNSTQSSGHSDTETKIASG